MKRLIACSVAFSLIASALAANFTTEKFQTRLSLSQDRTLEVEEDISVTFLVAQHGLIRNIPYKYYKDGRPTRTINFSLVSVSLDTGNGFQIVPCSQGTNNRDWVLKIGDKNRTLTGRARYKILYRANRVITDFATDPLLGPHSELLWNAIGASWPTTIDSASAIVEFPAPHPGKFAFRAVVGELGQKHGVNLQSIPSQKTANNLTVQLSHSQDPQRDHAVATVQKALSQGEGLTIALALPQGTLAARDAEVAASTPDAGSMSLPLFDQTTTELPSSPLGYFIPIIVLPLLYWITRGNFVRFKGPLVTRFEAPDGVSAPLSGYLLDSRVDPRDVVSGIVSLAQKGAARLRNVTAGQMQVELLGLDRGRDLSVFERDLYGALEPYGPLVDPTQLRGEFSASYGQLSRCLMMEAIEKKFFRSSTASKGCLWGCGFFVALLAISAICLFFSPIGTAVGFVISGIAGIVLLARMTNLLPAGAVAKGQILGLKEFISRAQKDELRSMLGREPDQALFETLLPYAVAFGMVDRWFKAFEGINIAQPEWFVSDASDLYWAAAFSNSFDDFSSSYGSSMAYSPPSPTSTWDEGSGFSSGSSGFDSGSFGGGDSGGSVGDGGGGGGGDSW